MAVKEDDAYCLFVFLFFKVIFNVMVQENLDIRKTKKFGELWRGLIVCLCEREES